MFILGLTGGIACGKTTATNFFFKKGIEIVDAVEISRKLQKNGQPAFDAIYSKYGPSILGPDQEIDRKIEMVQQEYQAIKDIADSKMKIMKTQEYKVTD